MRKEKVFIVIVQMEKYLWLDALVEQMTEQDTFDEESGLALHDVIEQAANHGVDFEAMETGEVATFAATATAPEGYLVAKDVEFEVKDTAEVQKVVMVDEEKPKESTPEGGKPSKDAPKTGDNTNLLLWLLVLGMSLSGVVVLGRKIKKK